MSFENAVKLGNFDDFSYTTFLKVVEEIIGNDLMVESWRDVNYHIRLIEHDTYEGIFNWHIDGLGYGPHGHRWIIIWSNSIPTEFLLPDCDDVVRPEPGDVILFNNREMKHRTPAAARGSTTRKFWRITLSNRVTPDTETIERWRSEFATLLHA